MANVVVWAKRVAGMRRLIAEKKSVHVEESVRKNAF
jgi:hypothetical protein